jgi:hypothetical protein
MARPQLEHPLFVEPLEQLASAERERLLAPPRRDQLREVEHVDPDAVAVEAHRVPRRPHVDGSRTER